MTLRINLFQSNTYPPGSYSLFIQVNQRGLLTHYEIASKRKSDEEDHPLPPSRLTVFAAAISVEAHEDGSDHPGKKTIIRASSRFFRNFERKKEIAEFQKAVNLVIQKIAYDVANLLLQGYAEPVSEHPRHDNSSLKKSNYFWSIKKEETHTLQLVVD